MRTPTRPDLDSELAWKEFTDPSGQQFRLNVLTGEAQWDLKRPQKEPETASEIGAAEKSVTASRVKPENSAASNPVTEPEEKAQKPDAATMHGWLDSWLGWGETVVDPASQEVRADVAKDLGLPAPPPTSEAAHGLRRHTVVEAVEQKPLLRTQPTAESVPRAGQVHAASAHANSGTATAGPAPQKETRIAIADEPPRVATDAAAAAAEARLPERLKLSSCKSRRRCWQTLTSGQTWSRRGASASRVEKFPAPVRKQSATARPGMCSASRKVNGSTLLSRTS